MLTSSYGSSLRTRGTAEVKMYDQDNMRFIPAYAGNGQRPPHRGTADAVHPCVRGERALPSPKTKDSCGSSLRTRGTVSTTRGVLSSRRFIPAYAGNGLTDKLLRNWQAVHPCVRGERPPSQWARYAQAGSSLRTRGTADMTHYLKAHGRFIPAYAGNGQRMQC